LELDEIEDLEAARAEQTEAVAMSQVELDPPTVGAPVEPVQAELGPHEPLPDGAGVRAAQDHQRGGP
jgi:hypothetical protein